VVQEWPSIVQGNSPIYSMVGRLTDVAECTRCHANVRAYRPSSRCRDSSRARSQTRDGCPAPRAMAIRDLRRQHYAFFLLPSAEFFSKSRHQLRSFIWSNVYVVPPKVRLRNPCLVKPSPSTRHGALVHVAASGVSHVPRSWTSKVQGKRKAMSWQEQLSSLVERTSRCANQALE